MKKKYFIIPSACLIVLLGLIFWNVISDYSLTLKANWDSPLPISSYYYQIYHKSSASSFNGDGLRYHIFSYKQEEPVDNAFKWTQKQAKTIYHDSFSEAATCWLDELDVPTSRRPDLKNCRYWYKSQIDNSEIIIFKDSQEKRLYIIESFL